MAFCAEVRLTPARAAMASIGRTHMPDLRTSSPMILSAASSATVKRAARAGGIGPEAASRRRRSIATERTGGRCGFLAGNSEPARRGPPTGLLVAFATVCRACIASESRPASSSDKAPEDSPAQMAALSASNALGEADAMAASISFRNTSDPLMGPHRAKRSRRGKQGFPLDGLGRS